MFLRWLQYGIDSGFSIMIRKLLPFILLVFISCDKYDARMVVSSKRLDDIYVAIANADNLDNAVELSLNNDDDKYYYTRKISSNSEERIQKYGLNSWYQLATSKENKSLFIFVFSENTILKHNWEEIKSNSEYERKIELSIGDLESLGWHVEIY